MSGCLADQRFTPAIAGYGRWSSPLSPSLQGPAVPICSQRRFIPTAGHLYGAVVLAPSDPRLPLWARQPAGGLQSSSVGITKILTSSAGQRLGLHRCLPLPLRAGRSRRPSRGHSHRDCSFYLCDVGFVGQRSTSSPSGSRPWFV